MCGAALHGKTPCAQTDEYPERDTVNASRGPSTLLDRHSHPAEWSTSSAHRSAIRRPKPGAATGAGPEPGDAPRQHERPAFGSRAPDRAVQPPGAPHIHPYAGSIPRRGTGKHISQRACCSAQLAWHWVGAPGLDDGAAAAFPPCGGPHCHCAWQATEATHASLEAQVQAQHRQPPCNDGF